jgi:hypothetical protein
MILVSFASHINYDRIEFEERPLYRYGPAQVGLLMFA